MASVVLMACDRREMGPYGEIGIHGWTGGSYGNKRQTKSAQEWIQRQEDKVKALYVERSSLTEAEVEEMFTDDAMHYFGAKEALERGLVDAIVGPGQ